MSGRKYLPTLAELVDRLCIVQLKEINLGGELYREEKRLILHDIDILLKERAQIVLRPHCRRNMPGGRGYLMGNLLRFPLSPAFVDRFPLFVETGIGSGISLGYAASHAFRELWSIDSWEPHYLSAVRTFQHHERVHPILGDSAEELEDLLVSRRIDVPVFFFLDAHFPGADFGGNDFRYETDPGKRLPLKRELAVLRKHLDIVKDCCILIDDLRFYQDGGWGDGDMQDYSNAPVRSAALEALPPEERNLDFLKEWVKTHEVMIERRDSGYAIIKPPNTPDLRFSE